MTFDVKKRLDEMRGEWAKLTGQGEHSTPPPGMTFEGMTVGDLFEWSDPWIEADYPNTLTNTRRLTGKIVHMHGHQRWGWGLKIQLIDVPEGDPLKVGDEVFRWGDRLRWDGKIKRLPM